MSESEPDPDPKPPDPDPDPETPEGGGDDGGGGDGGQGDGEGEGTPPDTTRQGSPPSFDVSAPMEGTNVFEGIYGHGGAKLILRSALRSGDKHVLMVGPPGSGKSAFLLALESKLPGVVFRDAKSLKASGLQDLLYEDPPILLIDEFDRLSMGCFDVLSVPMEHGRIQKEGAHEKYDKPIGTQIIASCNPTDRIPENIRSRFGKPIVFEEYSYDEYLDVCQHMLVDQQQWIETPSQARSVAEMAHDMSDSTDPRDARDVAQLASSFEEVEMVAKALHDPDADIGPVELKPMEIARTKDEVRKEWVSQLAVEDLKQRFASMPARPGGNGSGNGGDGGGSGEDDHVRAGAVEEPTAEEVAEVEQEIEEHVEKEISNFRAIPQLEG